MSALRAHFSSANSQRSAKSTQLGSTKGSSNDGSTRQPSKLAKKSSKLPAASQTTQGRAPSNGSSVIATRASSKTTTITADTNTTLNQLRDQMQASESYRTILPPPHILRTPSLVSGSSVSTFESPRSNVLRRKPSTIGKFVANKKSEALEHERSTMQSRNEDYTETMDDSVFGIAMPYSGIPASNTPHSIAHSDSLYTTAGTTISNTPSTRYTDSPFSHVPTPSSFSSQSTMPMATRDGSKLSREVSRDAVMSPVEAMRQEKASRRTSMIPAREPSSRIVRTAESLAAPGKAQYREGATQNDVKATSRASARRSVNPPELAHLNTSSPRKQSGPARPSRDGAPPLNIASPTSPIVQSELPSTTFHRRTSSRDSIASSSSHGFRSRFGLSPKPTSDRGSPSTGRVMSPTDSDAGSVAAFSDHKPKPDGHKPSTPTPAASPAPGKTRTFGFLSRKPKDETTTKLEKPKREARKMPSAGTGHERYGRFGFGHRNGSVSPSIGGRSPSTDSLSSTKSSSFLRRKSSGASDKASELDEFLRDRLSPVVLRGSGTPSVPSSSMSSTTPGHSAGNGLGLVTSASQSSLSRPNIALSPQTSQIVSPVSISAASGANTLALASAADGVDGLYDEPEEILEIMDGKEGMWLRSAIEPKKPARKWNFLQRLQSSPAKTRQAGGVTSPSIVDLHRTNFDNAAHSALMDAIEPIDLIEVEKLVLEDDPVSPPTPAEGKLVMQAKQRGSLLPSPMGSHKTSNNRLAPRTAEPDKAKESLSLPDHSSTTAGPSNSEQSQAALHTPELNGSESSRLSRLSPIGRIPQVVSKRDRERKLPDTSFSRPFVNTQPRPNVKPPGALYTQIRDLASPVEPLVQESPSTQAAHEQYASSQNRRSSRSDYAMHSASNLFSWSSRKNSELSYSSSSDTASWMAYSRMQAMQYEDVWNEYDDLIDDAALGKPSTYHKASFSSHQSPQESFCAQETPYFGLPPTREPSHALPRPPKLSRENSSASASQAGQQSMYSLTRAVLSRQSTSSGTSIDSSRNSHISSHSRAASFGGVNVRSSYTSFSSTARKRESIKVQAAARQSVHSSVNLKLEALMISKLLSFGRVLFSPAHNEMRLADEPRILILDGLGSDWSYFVAMFYPQATIYNLGPSGKQSSGHRDGLQQLSNHRNIAHAAIGAPLPFPKGFFTAAVFRFPIATTDPAYHSCIAEFKRVLRPGGHLEVSVLDIDLGNAGDRARKAIRGLKTRMQLREENISLRSLSDFILQSVGKRGFVEVQQCIIGVPVMCRGSQQSDAGSVSSETTPGGYKSPKRGSELQGTALANLVESEQQQQQQQTGVDESSDEKMTKSVARVGRWWYSQCYERQVLSTDQSIWADDALLSECQAQGTSFRLLICHAQKPSQVCRRTMSV